MDRDDGVGAIVFAAEHLLDLAGLHFLRERVERLPELGIHGLAGFGPLDEDREVVAFSGQRLNQLAILLEATAALQDLLRFRLVLPEIRRGRAVLEPGQFFVGAGGFKDSSADPRRVC